MPHSDEAAVSEPVKKTNDKPRFPTNANTEQYANWLDEQDPLRKFRGEFIVPTKESLKSKRLSKPDESSAEPCIYFVGNSLGAQPKAAAEYFTAHLNTWASIGVNGHFTPLENSPLVEWQSMAERASQQSSRLVGALPEEVAIMGTLTSNLHCLMASFYKPTTTRHKIILEWKAFPSDHVSSKSPFSGYWTKSSQYMFESQIRWHGLEPKQSMIMIAPELEKGDYVISTENILSVIDKNAVETAMILLPGIQYYSGQWFDMQTITRHAQSKGIVVGWDLAHAAGNVPLHLHDWNVDFAAWCTYKYMNAGPGAIAGLFVHERHGKIDYRDGPGSPKFLNRLSGWYGGDKASRFNMDNKFKPCPGASGWQMSNPSVADLTSLCSSLSIFNKTSMTEIRRKSIHITAYLEHLLLQDEKDSVSLPYRILTPSDPAARGAQLSILLNPHLLPPVFQKLSDDGYLFDQRRPDVIRIAPTPLYNTYTEVYRFVRNFKAAIEELR
ncbi:MAG: Kynureninase (L-kynurenine hydrolase) [Claussenomyces sp. TS43310]|nr:MAG: Kynureninase (L-kynurenine hydrolase) [Claussenomyces sp. TS43310]